MSASVCVCVCVCVCVREREKDREIEYVVAVLGAVPQSDLSYWRLILRLPALILKS